MASDGSDLRWPLRACSPGSAAKKADAALRISLAAQFPHFGSELAQLSGLLAVPARDAQLILGHSRLAVTLEIYTHEDRQAQRDVLGQISDALGHRGGTGRE